MSLSAWRERIADRLLRWMAVLGGIAYVPSLALSVHARLWNVAIVDTGAYAAVIALFFLRRRLAQRTVSLVIVGMFFGLGVFLIELLGPFSAGPLWLFSFAAMSAILFGLRGAQIASALTFVTLLALGLRLGFGFLLPAHATTDTTWVWAIVAANFVFLSSVVSLSIAVILRGLEMEMRQREEAEASLRQVQKMEAVGTMAGGIAHDLNNMLQPMLMYANLVKQSLGPDHEAQADVDVIVTSVERARALVKKILSFSRREQTQRVPVHLRHVVDDTLTLLRTSLPANVRAVQDMQAISDTVLADPTELQQVVLNLCTNALFAMRDKPEGVLKIGLSAQQHTLLLEVSDNGAGMDAATVERAFEPFFTTKKEGEGTGLGLAMVKRIVNDLGGSVSVSSSAGVGTRLEVSLPLIDPPRSEPAQRDVP